jgi:hypothetical protein
MIHPLVRKMGIHREWFPKIFPRQYRMLIHYTEQGRRYLTERKTRKIDLIFDRFFWHADMRYAIRGQISLRGLEHLFPISSHAPSELASPPFNPDPAVEHCYGGG